jgi:predicted dienelactone hydrolase
VQWTDPDRPEPATPDPADRRTVVAQLWYPARPVPPAVPRARYLGRDAAEAAAVGHGLAAQFGLPEIAFDELVAARTAAVAHAPADTTHGPHPVVLFSPGLAGVRTQNTAWAQELASHGYVATAPSTAPPSCSPTDGSCAAP